MKPHSLIVKRNKLEISLKLLIHFFNSKKNYTFQIIKLKDVLYPPFLLSSRHQKDKHSMARIQNYCEIAANCNYMKSEFPSRLKRHPIPWTYDKEMKSVTTQTSGFGDFEILLMLHICKWRYNLKDRWSLFKILHALVICKTHQ